MSEASCRPDRRTFLAGAAAAVLLPGPAGAAANPTLRAMLDAAAAETDPARRLAALHASPVSAQDRPVWTMVVRGIEREQALRRAFPYGKTDGGSPYAVSQRHGQWLDLGPKGDPAAVAAKLDEETARLRSDAALGIAPPAFIVEAVLEGQKGARPSDQRVREALGRQQRALEAIRPRPGAGVWRVPGGAGYYALRLRCTIGTDLTPTEVDRRVRAETASLLARADGLLKGLGLTRGSVGARLRALKEQADYLYSNDDSGRARAVADMNAALGRLRPRLPAWFNAPYAAEAGVRRMSADDAFARRRGYREPPFYYPDLASVEDRPDFTLTTVAYHETIPGHLLQLAHQAAADPHPLQVRYAAGYAEGWAIYAESLADRMGLLSPVQQLGCLQSILFRLARVTADIGLHVHRWERAEAIRYLQETVGFELFFPFEVEVDRYVVEPAGFAGDALMAIALMRRGRALAPAAARAFHDKVLNRGPLSRQALF